ncbi:S8 family peptidase [Asanoa ishikariensis]|uniref:S8 family peptidase n=1 Tax=Asanoa ishikariensis TaxID=137265 RepID=UPI000B894B16|nr:S8 family peptidase [Asanoa ishikariensis]
MLGIPRAGRRRSAAVLVAAATLSAFTLTSASAQAAPPAVGAAGAPTQTYIVQTSEAPAATYNGGVAGLAPTRVAAGAKLDGSAKNVRAYRQHLAQARNRVLDRAGVSSGKVKYDYTLVFAGFSAELTVAEAARLKKTPGVANVWKNEVVHSETFTTPAFVGLDGKSGAWRKEFGSPERAGEGMIIGVIDSGFWPENPSFGPLPTPRRDQKTIDAKWHGSCDPGVERPITCNNKVIGARWYASDGEISHANAGEFDSPRDYYGHGSHTASTAGGNHNVTATINGGVAGVISGMAPAARLSIYKVLYANNAGTQSTGNSTDIVAAIEQAVADGVDVINYSIGDSLDSFSAVELAFLNAANAGVFVATSAGNSGPDAATVDNGMPWTTTVAAGTHDRSATKTVTLGNGQVFQGAGTGPVAASAPIVDARTSGAAGSTEQSAAQCVSNPPSLDPAKVAGKIVLCERGNNARVDKSLAVKNAGGVGMVQFNPTANSLNADFHAVPSIHVDQTAGAAIKAYIGAGGNPTATISAASNAKVRAPLVATFSSRGPGASTGGDLLKPDIMAPGVDVVAATGPESHNGNLWDTNSGTSMASPHIAGIGALILAKHPNWSPMMVKSALMTTAGVRDNEGQPIQDQADGTDANPLEMGAGQVAANEAFDPGLVYDSGITQWLQYACGIGADVGDACDSVGSVDPSNFNNPALSVGDLAHKQTLTRTVTNVSKLPALYLPTVQAPPGIKVDVSPKIIALLPGKKQSFKVTFTRTTAALGEWSFGSLRWRDLLGHDVRSAIAIRPVAAAVRLEQSGSGASGQVALPVTPGYTGTLGASGHGLQAATVDRWTLAPNEAVTVDVTVPEGTKVARFATFDADYPTGTDIDLTVYRLNPSGPPTQVGQSAGGTAEESVTLTQPGTYVVEVVLFAASGPLEVKHHRWAVPAGNAGNLTVTPPSQPVTAGGAASVTAAWSGLTPGQRYLGVIEYTDGTTTVGSTNLFVVA